MQGNVEVNMLVITLLFKKVDSQFECFLKGERERERERFQGYEFVPLSN